MRALDPLFAVGVTGDPAEIVDLRDSVTDRLPAAVAILVVATFALLFLMTGSVVVPLKAIVMNVLSLGATFGALVLVFQDGHLAGLLGFDAPGSLDLLMPVIVFLFAFGLSMDYEVFLLSRIREAWEETGDNDRAVAEGLQRSGRIITSRRCSWSSCSPGSRRARWWPSSSWGSAWLWPWWSTPPWCGRCWCPRP